VAECGSELSSLDASNPEELNPYQRADLLIAFYAALLPRRGRILRRTLSVRLSVCPSVSLSVRPSRYRYRASRRAT